MAVISHARKKVYHRPVLLIRSAGSCGSLDVSLLNQTTQQQGTSNPGCEKRACGCRSRISTHFKFHDGGLLSAVWSRCQSRHMLRGGRQGNDEAEWLSYLARAARAGTSAGARAAGGAGAGWRDSRSAEVRGRRGGVDGMCRPGQYGMNRWYSLDGITRPTTWREGTHQGDMLI